MVMSIGQAASQKCGVGEEDAEPCFSLYSLLTL
jgi:hypothetical protein